MFSLMLLDVCHVCYLKINNLLSLLSLHKICIKGNDNEILMIRKVTDKPVEMTMRTEYSTHRQDCTPVTLDKNKHQTDVETRPTLL